jgi:membrane associated rhomboid family serine protease
MAMAAAMRCYRHPDRETYISCSECGRPICTECMTPAPVGQRCPEHSGKPQGVARMTGGLRGVGAGTTGLVTRILIGINVAIYLLELAQGAGINANSGSIYVNGVLVASAREIGGQILPAGLGVGHLIGVAHGDWWRLISAAFLHYGPIHLGFNMFFLYWIGTPVEEYLGRARYLLVYLVSGLAGSAGALVLTPNSATVGASGAIFGILGAALVLERQGSYVLGGSAMGLIVINLALGFFLAGISIGGHIGGLIGGAACMLVLSRFGRGHGAYGRIGAVGIAGVVAVAALSIAIAYWKVRGYA